MLRSINLIIAAAAVATTIASVSTADARDGGGPAFRHEVVFVEQNGPDKLVLPVCRRCAENSDQATPSPDRSFFEPRWDRVQVEKFQIRFEMNPAYSR